MRKKANTTDNENSSIKLGRGGGWGDFDETEQPVHSDPAGTLAFLNPSEGVNFVDEFVRQYAEQQGHLKERRKLLGDFKSISPIRPEYE